MGEKHTKHDSEDYVASSNKKEVGNQAGEEANPHKVGKDFLLPLSFFVLTVIYLEVTLHILVYRSIGNRLLYPILFALPTGALITVITGLFSPQVNKILMWVFESCICLLFSVQLIYYATFKVFFSFQSLGMAGDAISEFYSLIISAILHNFLFVLLLFLPLLGLAYMIHQYKIHQQRRMLEHGIRIGTTVLLHAIALLSLLLYGRADYSPYDLYHKTKVVNLCGSQLGIITMTRFDLRQTIFKNKQILLAENISDIGIVPTAIPRDTVKKNTPTPVPPLTERQQNPSTTKMLSPTQVTIDTSPNIINIDFKSLAENEKNSAIKTMHYYFNSIAPTNKNKYTGLLKGYNLIMITAEGFSPYAVHKELTPTLYRLINEGFVFQNFYTPLWQTSTSDGEFVACTGLIPIGTRSMYRSRNNYMPFSLGNQFNQIGVESKAYHNHTYTYYQRNETHPNLGYQFKAKGNGLVLKNPDIWPESDLEMMEATVGEYIEEEQFHVYYLTVSGHMNYTFGGNRMASKNRDLVKDLPYSSECKAYIACQIELDKAIELLITKLKNAGVGDKTVIALSADHYPYGWDKDRIDELAGHEVDPNFEIYKNHFILWSAGLKENIVVEKPCSSLDILPTLLNLFGFEYDSRLLMGQDIFSDADPLVILSNRSFITDKVKYNAANGQVIPLTKEELPEDYINTINKKIKAKFNISQSIIEKDYYNKIWKEDRKSAKNE